MSCGHYSGMNIGSMPRHAKLLVDMVNEGIAEELRGMSADFAIQIKEVALSEEQLILNLF